MITRREALIAIGATGTAGFLPITGFSKDRDEISSFRYCLNTSTISGQKLGISQYVEIAADAGYDGIEVWIRDLKEYTEAGNSLASLRGLIERKGIKVENAIGFAPWLAEGEEEKQQAFKQMREEMLMLKEIGGTRIAAAPAGLSGDKPLDLFKAGKRYGELLELGRETGVMPQLEFWGPSPVLYHMGQVLMMAAAANDADARILPDVYHLFRGGSGFESLKMLNGSFIEVFHMNDFPHSKPRTEQSDADRIYPGDGAAPLKQILTDLKVCGGTTVLSLELFNREYWKEDPLAVAKMGIKKMKGAVSLVE
ncbi:MAG: xylose isomerase [Cyclobacteriaceae bacterium]|nr:MAG: xylose isomerase [Cyclobacteriaceae bacterium]